MKDYHPTVIISGTTADAGYTCYDVDPVDHEAKCTGSDNCVSAFAGKDAKEQVAANCPDGCKFMKAPAAAKKKLPHPPIIDVDGYAHWAGVCRGPGDPGSLEAKPNGKYGKTPTMSQKECAAACTALSKCIAYAHSTGWCLIYGEGLDVTAEDGHGDWTKDSHANLKVTQTKPNEQYICGVKCGMDSGVTCPSSDSIASTASPEQVSRSVHEQGITILSGVLFLAIA
jgi:hypothetical protein